MRGIFKRRTKWKRKEYYNNGKLEFEGEYLNDKRFIGTAYNKKWIGTGYNEYGGFMYKLKNNINGKGKEYYNSGELQFEGEYLNGKRNGQGKEYYKDGKIEFEGEYLDGKRNGKGKEYNY